MEQQVCAQLLLWRRQPPYFLQHCGLYGEHQQLLVGDDYEGALAIEKTNLSPMVTILDVSI